MSPESLEGGSRAPDCLSDLAFDRLRSGELHGIAEATQRRAHIASCPRCAARFAAFGEQAVEFRRRAPRIVARVTPRRAGRRLLPLLLYATAAAAAVAFLLLRHPPAPDGQLLPGGTTMPGDALRFRVFAPRARFLALLSVDGAGTLSSYLPPAPMLLPLRAEARQELAGAIEMDEVLGAERLIALLCPQRLTVDLVLERQSFMDPGPFALAGKVATPLHVV